MVTAPDLYDARGNLLAFPVQKADTFVPAETPFSSPSSASSAFSREGYLAVKEVAYDLFRQNWLVWAYATVIAQVLMRDPLRFSDPKHPAVPAFEAFFADVNPDQSLQELLYPIAIDIVLTGEAYLLIKRDGKQPATTKPNPPRASGSFVGLERLINRITLTVPDKETGRPAYVEQKVGVRKRQTFNLADVIVFRVADPDSLVNGISPLEPLELILATEIEAAKSYKSYFANGMIGNKILTMKNGDPAQAERARSILADIYTDPKNHHRPLVLFGDIQPVSDGADLADMPHEKGREYNIDMAGAVFSVPRSKLFPDQHGGLGQAGKAVDDVTFRADTVAPLQGLMAAAITRQFIRRECGISGLKLEAPNKELIRFDLFDVAEKVTHFGGTGNEARAIVNLPPVDDPNMDKPLFLVRGVDLLAESFAPEDETTAAQGTGDATAAADQPDIVPQNRPPASGAPPPKASGPSVAGAGRAETQKAQALDSSLPAGPAPSRDEQKAAAATVHAATLRAGAALAALVDRYAAGGITQRALTRDVRATQATAVAVATRHAAALHGGTGQHTDARIKQSSADVVALAVRAHAGTISRAQARSWATGAGGLAWSVFQSAKRAAAGDPYMQWDEDPGAQHCDECPQYFGEVHRARQWPVQPGDLACVWRCRCDLIEVDAP